MRRLALITLTGTIVVIGAAAVVPALSASSNSRADGTKESERRHATAVLVDDLPSPQQRYEALILRQGVADGGDVVILRRSTANGRLLDEAVRALLHDRAIRGTAFRSRDGRSVSRITLGVRGKPAPAGWGNRMIPLAQRIVDSLFRAPPRTIAGVGNVPAVEFYLPRPKGNASGQKRIGK